jgi:hypothetical protein
VDLLLKAWILICVLLFVAFLAIHLRRIRRAWAMKRMQRARRGRIEGAEDDFDPDFLVELAERRHEALQRSPATSVQPPRQLAPGEGEVVVHLAGNDVEATLLCQALRNEGIRCRIHGGEAFPRDPRAGLNLIVFENDFEPAARFIASWKKGMAAS